MDVGQTTQEVSGGGCSREDKEKVKAKAGADKHCTVPPRFQSKTRGTEHSNWCIRESCLLGVPLTKDPKAKAKAKAAAGEKGAPWPNGIDLGGPCLVNVRNKRKSKVKAGGGA